jgi:hypothetical protein
VLPEVEDAAPRADGGLEFFEDAYLLVDVGGGGVGEQHLVHAAAVQAGEVLGDLARGPAEVRPVPAQRDATCRAGWRLDGRLRPALPRAVRPWVVRP